MLQAWYMDNETFDQRLEHRNPTELVSLEELYNKTGVEYFSLQLNVNTNTTDGYSIKKEPGHPYEDERACSNECKPNNQNKSMPGVLIKKEPGQPYEDQMACSKECQPNNQNKIMSGNLIKKEPGHPDEDQTVWSKECQPNNEKMIKSSFTEQLHTDEKTRFVLDVSGYFDVRASSDQWIRIAVSAGDMIVIPTGTYHRFTRDTDQVQNNDAPLAEALADDSGSEADDTDKLTFEEILAALHIEERETSGGVYIAEGVPGGEEGWEFEWSDDYELYHAKREEFPQEVGPTIAGDSPADIFIQLWDRPLVENIVQETNRYAWQTIAQASETGISNQSRLNDWVETSVSEIYRLIAVITLMGMCVRSRVDEYWTTGVMGMPDFRRLMSRDRYLLLFRFLHFVDNDLLCERGQERKAAKIKPVITYLIEKFQSAYRPRKELSLDESLLPWRGRSSWAQCFRTNAARFGIKTFELCEAVSGYVLNILLCTRKSIKNHDGPRFLGSTAKIVLSLMTNYLGKGYILFVDKFYNSVDLCRYLKRRSTDVVGTLNRRMPNTPADINNIDERQVTQGTVVSRHCGDVSVTAWKDSVKLVTTVSTYHKNDMVTGRRAGEDIQKPVVIQEYNRFMGGVDLKDQKLSTFLLERKGGMKWYIKVFRRLLNITILNSYIIYNSSGIGRRRKLNQRLFRYQLAAELGERYGAASAPIPRSHIATPIARLDRSFDHFPERTEGSERSSAKDNKLKRMCCVRCLAQKKRTMSTISCSHCKIFLCVGQCWKDYHTLPSL